MNSVYWIQDRLLTMTWEKGNYIFTLFPCLRKEYMNICFTGFRMLRYHRLIAIRILINMYLILQILSIYRNQTCGIVIPPILGNWDKLLYVPVISMPKYFSLLSIRYLSTQIPTIKEKYCGFCCKTFRIGIFEVKMRWGYINLRFRICQASCTFVITKLRFVVTKVTCRLLRIGAISSLFRPAKCFQTTYQPSY